jgi:hypothetical protein
MKWFTWTSSGWRPRAIFLVTTILLVCIASNPELSALIPVIDALGLDVLMYLFAVQLSVLVGGLLWPPVRCKVERIGMVAVRFALHASIASMGGYLRQLLWHARLVGSVTMALRPENSFKPTPLRGST